jgi:redox-sensitive bicupin YhaK (pirin superfamily)
MTIPTTPGKIFLADERGLTVTAQHQRYATFSFGEYNHAHKAPFGRLQACNEESLAGGQQLALPVPVAACVLLLPIMGTVLAGTSPGELAAAEVEQLHLLALPAGSTLHLANPYPTEVISFLHLWLHAPETPASREVAGFQLADLRNRLVPLLPPATGCTRLPFRVALGRFAGRQETMYRVTGLAGSVFAFVLAGAFEVEGRLLHEKDGLALWDTATVELEALSPDALILVLELAP